VFYVQYPTYVLICGVLILYEVFCLFGFGFGVFLRRVSLCWPQTHYAVQSDLEPAILLPQSPQCWGYTHTPPHSTLQEFLYGMDFGGGVVCVCVLQILSLVFPGISSVLCFVFFLRNNKC
jgi:hypothetical protein